MGLKTIPMRAETGPIGGDLSHEFIVLAETGESGVFCHKDLLDMPIPDENTDFYGDLEPIVQERTSLYAATEDVHDAARFEKEVPADKRLSARGIEVGQVFNFSTKYSLPMKAVVAGADGKDVAVESGSYGVGVSRLLGAIIEASHDANGIIWPEAVAPFKVGLINIRVGDAPCDKIAEAFYATLTKAGIEVLYDDTAESAGKKFSSMDLIGLPWQVVVGPKGAAAGVVELKNRRTGEKTELAPDAAMEKLK
jgi:prolyl-tRNA synthetase